MKPQVLEREVARVGPGVGEGEPAGGFSGRDAGVQPVWDRRGVTAARPSRRATWSLLGVHSGFREWTMRNIGPATVVNTTEQSARRLAKVPFDCPTLCGLIGIRSIFLIIIPATGLLLGLPAEAQSPPARIDGTWHWRHHEPSPSQFRAAEHARPLLPLPAAPATNDEVEALYQQLMHSEGMPPARAGVR